LRNKICIFGTSIFNISGGRNSNQVHTMKIDRVRSILLVTLYIKKEKKKSKKKKKKKKKKRKTPGNFGIKKSKFGSKKHNL
jgi:hypothetical protein